MTLKTPSKENKSVPHMVWPAIPPDLNPIQHVWDQLKQRLDDRTPPPPCHLAELRVALVEEWNALPQNNIMRLVRSMRRRCQAVIPQMVETPATDIVNFCYLGLSLLLFKFGG
uniref:Tc1-like transposase DDE domain-containing protein n=1 Tax=Stegastes partitus TaxID=144197 RepID=A0A3B5AE73_9TELE